MRINFDTISKLVLNTAHARRDGREFVWENVNLPVASLNDKSLISLESAFKTGSSNNRTLTISMSNITASNNINMWYGYDAQKLFDRYAGSNVPSYNSNVGVFSDYCFFKTSNTSPYFRLRFSQTSNASVINVASFEQSTDNSNWTWASNFPISAANSNVAPVQIFENWTSLSDAIINSNSGFISDTKRMYFSGGTNVFTSNNATSLSNDFSNVFAQYGSNMFLNFYVPATKTYGRLRFTYTTSSTARQAMIWVSSDGVNWYFGAQTNSNIGLFIPGTGGGSTPCFLNIIDRNAYDTLTGTGATIIQSSTVQQIGSYSSMTSNNTKTLAVMNTPIGMGGSYKVKGDKVATTESTNATPVARTVPFVNTSFRMNLMNTNDVTQPAYINPADTLQFTFKVFNSEK